MRQSSVAVADFPLDLLSNILCWLPTKSLFRFKCVCKTWNALTSDPSFVKKHLEACSKCTNRSTIILREEKLYSVDFNLLDKVVEVDHPLSHCGGWTDILGSCNGLLCLYNEEEHYALWNPLTGRYFRLSVSTNLPPKGPNLFRCFVHGFGYDSTSDDYKIIRIVDFHGNFGEFVRSDVQLYSLKANCWRKVQAFPYILSYPCTGVLANGSLYWVARQSEELDSDYYLIMAFDLGLEKCRMVPQPNYAERSFHMSLGLQGGQVCILCHYPKHRVDMWVMNCQTGSWLKLLSITQRKEIRKFEYIKPIAYSKNGSEVLLEQDYKKFLWFNLEKKTVRYVKIQGLPKSFDSEFVSGNYETDVPTQRAIQKSGNKKQRDGVDDFLSVGFKLKL